MSRSLRVSVRSVLIAGMSATIVGAAAITPVSAPALAPVHSLSPAVQLSAALTPLLQPAVTAAPAASTDTLGSASPTAAAVGGAESFIKNTYNAVEPWVAWGFELAQWAMGFVPILWWVAPGVDLAYFTIEPLVQAGVYAFADVVGLNFSQIGPDVTAGIKQSVNNFFQYSWYWITSLVPFPPLPPFPPRPGASVSLQAAAATRPVAAAAVAAPVITDAAVAAQEPDAGAASQVPTAEQAAAPVAIAPAKGHVSRGSAKAARSAAGTVAVAPAPAAATAADPAPGLTAPALAPDEDVAPTKASRKAPARSASAADHPGKAARSVVRAG